MWTQQWVLLLAVALFCLQACGPKKIVIPEMMTPQEQYALALEAFQEAQGILVEGERQDQAILEAEAAFRLVIERFPNDDRFTPESELMLGETALLKRDFPLAVERYQEALDHYPNNHRVQTLGLFRLGESLDSIRKYRKAKEAYKLLIDRYEDDENPSIQRLVDRAREKYRSIRVE